MPLQKCQVSESARLAWAAGQLAHSTYATLSASCNSRRSVNINWLQDNKAAAAAARAACGVHVANNQLCKQKPLSHTHKHAQRVSLSAVVGLAFYLISLRWQFLIARRI